MIKRFFCYFFAMFIGIGMVKELPAIGAPSLFFGMLAMYMLPTIEAHLKKHPNIASISVLNLFLGWTLVGWVLALVWVLKKPEA